MVAGIAGLVILVVFPGLPAVVAGILLLGLGMGWVVAVFSQFMDYLAEGERGTGFGLVQTVFMIVAAAGSVAVGFLADQFGWAVSFGTLGVLLAIVLGLLAVNGTYRSER